MDFNQYKEPLCLHPQPNSFQSKFKYFSDKMAKKTNNLVFKNNEESFNNNAFFSSKTYPNISNSILAYVVGGFVGSKSQMNNNKHLLYDLSAVISNLLNSTKYDNDKISPKKNENFCASTSDNFHENYNKFVVNESSQGKKKTRNLVNDKVNFFHSIDVPLQKFIDNEKEICNYNENHDSLIISADFKLQCCDTIEIIQVIDEVCNSQSSEDNSLDDVCMKIATAESLCDIQLQKNTVYTNTYNRERQKEQFESLFKKNINKTQNNLLKNHPNVSSPNSSNETYSKIQKNIFYNIELEKPVRNINLNLPSNFLAKKRFRRQSECSVESTDSESFIVFEEPCCLNGDKEKLNFNCEDDFTNAIYSDDSNNGDEDDIDNGINFTNNDNQDFLIVKTEKKNKGCLLNHDFKNHHFEVSKKVRFNDNIKINKIIAWDHAYRSARVGPWEQMACDRFRFQKRIAALSKIISPVLSIKHRTKIYNNLYS